MALLCKHADLLSSFFLYLPPFPPTLLSSHTGLVQGLDRVTNAMKEKGGKGGDDGERV